MIECPQCRSALMEAGQACTGCGFSAPVVDGFRVWAPEFTHGAAGAFFDPAGFDALAALEDANFWFQARNELILWALERYCGAPRRYAEIGCGTGYVLAAVERKLPECEVLGSELFVHGLGFAARCCRRAELVQMDARSMPYRGHFDAMGIFDVLEHIDEDRAVLGQIAQALVPGGGLLITVPQHAWLWSAVDEAACHVRRYSAAEIEGKVRAAGFDILRSTSFVSLLLPAMYASRWFARKPDGSSAGAELQINPVLNRLFRRVMALEFAMIRRGADLPLGGSRLIVARRDDR